MDGENIMEKIKKKLEEIKHNSIYKIEINEELKDYEINILEKSLKNDISKLSRLQYTNIEHIEINLNKKIINTIKQLEKIKNNINNVKIINENKFKKKNKNEFNVWKID